MTLTSKATRVKQSTFCIARRKSMITMGSSYFVWINTNEIISSWYLLDAVCVTPPAMSTGSQRARKQGVFDSGARTWTASKSMTRRPHTARLRGGWAMRHQCMVTPQQDSGGSDPKVTLTGARPAASFWK